MFRVNLMNSTRALAMLLSIIVCAATILALITIPSPVFSTVFTSSDRGQLSNQSATNGVGSLFQQIEQFLAPSGYDQAREDPSYAINIPFTGLGFSPFEPSEISIPANMTVIWFNEDESPHSVTFNETSPEPIQPATIASGGFFTHKFSTSGKYDYYDSENPSAKGRINVGANFEPGQNMNMLVGGDALPFEAGKVGRTTFSFVPHDNVTTIPPSLSITYNVTIADSNGTQLYSNQFDDSDGILDLELIPTTSSRSLSSNQTTTSNQTALNFVSWGPDLTDQEGVAGDGTFHVQGPVLTENEDYTIIVSITSIDNTAQPQPPSDDFLLPSVNFTDDSIAANFLSLDAAG
jgi:plastocyanin